ncbi:MAG TPA: DUF2325 domain-containing protein [Candidatus Limosilactobacillus merdigallinarum]|uniref:DUF2325 domain-containing protein n=1 Tax=Candidatus Limosilactobacillus merdigallinarum TaxID=2838652 RepID=A0A9D1VGN1_9LACO|nr:DUF2325 domain-containing protein [Candidatus Limosilactobacillus merdigallinarum]
MYDYRNDLLNIIENIDNSDEGLIRGRETLRAAMHLIEALPLDGDHRPGRFSIKHNGRHHHEPIHFQSTNNAATAQTETPTPASQAVKSPLNGDQYEALNKLKGIQQDLHKLSTNQDTDHSSANKLAARYHKITGQLSKEDKAVLADQLTPINHALNHLGVNQRTAVKHDETKQPADGQPGAEQTVTTPTAPAADTMQKSAAPKVKAPFSSQKRQYVVQRELNGATLLTENGQDAGHISESIVRKMNLTSGTIVKADIMPNDIFVHKSLRHIDHLGKTRFNDEERIDTFEFGVVKKHKHHLRVTYNSNNEPLMVNGKKHAFLLNIDNPIVGNGSIVELAWYKDDPDSMRIRWTYPTESPAKKDNEQSTKSQNKDDGQKEKPEQTLTKRYPDLDLAGKTVAVLVGNRQEHEDYEQQIKLYNGRPTIVDSFKTQKSYLKDKLKSADIVVLVKSKAHHGASKAVAEFQNQFGFAFAVADTLAMGQFEDALYRASHGLPADIASMDNLH